MQCPICRDICRTRQHAYTRYKTTIVFGGAGRPCGQRCIVATGVACSYACPRAGGHMSDRHSIPSSNPCTLPVHFRSAQLRGDSWHGAQPIGVSMAHNNKHTCTAIGASRPATVILGCGPLCWLHSRCEQEVVLRCGFRARLRLTHARALGGRKTWYYSLTPCE